MFRSTRAAALALPFLLCLCPTSTLSQQKDEAFYESVDVSVVNIEVFVTDGDGKRVTGLTRDDFEVYEDGKKVEVSYFYASEGTKTRRLIAGTPEAEAERLQLAVYFDLQSLPRYARPKLMGAVEDFLVARAQPGEKALIASYNGADSLRVRHVSMERQALSAVLQEIAAIRGLNPSGSADAGDIAVQSISDPGGGNSDLSAGMADLEAQEAAFNEDVGRLLKRADAKVAFDALTVFLEGLGSLPGRKALVYVGGGVTFSPGQSVFNALYRKYGGTLDETSIRPLERRMEEAVNSDRILFYALGARPNRDKGVLSLATATIQDLGSGGGFVDLNSDRVDATPEVSLAWVDEDIDSYYSLGFTPATGRKPGKTHDVEVKVKLPGLRVRHVEEYRDRTPRDRAHNQTLAALLFGGDATGNPLGARLEVGRAEAGKGKQVTVPITVKFPLSRMTLLPREGAWEGRLSLFLAARDADGRMSEITELLLPMRLKAQAAPGQPASYTTRMALRDAHQTIVLGIRDELGNTVSTVTAPYVPEAPAAAGERR
ncbi:MAG TPA: VWA domain-containing protein [Thermoanaerobaculia bacterium]|nr:VWA domain-containing protein [Thermoanaerobaculia bacterium]